MTLKYIAHSKKKKESAAGFYGIGRLVGGGYCKQLSFFTSAQGENVASEMVFDMDQIREILEDEEDNSSASEVIHKVTTFRNDIAEEPQKHYFKVVLKDILPDYHDVLLDENKINAYLMQVAPIPYEASFFNNLIKPNITKDDSKYLNYYNQLNAVKFPSTTLSDWKSHTKRNSKVRNTNTPTKMVASERIMRLSAKSDSFPFPTLNWEIWRGVGMPTHPPERKSRLLTHTHKRMF